MKKLSPLLAGVIIGVLVVEFPKLLAVSYPAPAPSAASATAPAAAPAQPQGTGTIVHPISKNITDRLTKSTRHMDIVKIKQGDREVETRIYYPMDKNKAMAVILIHEIFGVSDWMKACADQLAEAGYVVLVPDLLSQMGPNKGGTDDIPESQITTSVQRLPAAQVLADLTAVADYAKKMPECDGNIAIGGFCWGGGKAFAFSTVNKDIKAAFVFYGAPMLP
ncbi:MAG TPA: dienelactone hydrolase family protein, partial [Opitutales bacterium]|nr:dienelactone hydrolase family protein [Opitutales bacterium]